MRAAHVDDIRRTFAMAARRRKDVMRARNLFLLALVVAGWMFSSAAVFAQQETPKIAWRTDLDDAWRSTKTNQRLLLIYVKSDNCLYCDKMERDSYADPQVTQLIAEAYVPASLHASRQPELARKMGVQAFPTTVVIDSNGQLVDAVQGYVPPGKLAEWLSTLKTRRASSRRR
jgi:thioredoxin-related protein